jgi:hypothetical protein
MVHKFDHYKLSIAGRDTAGGQVEDYTLAHAAVPCIGLEDWSKLYDVYMQRDEAEQMTINFLDKEVFDDISMNDRIVFKRNNYRVYGRHDVGYTGRLFRLILTREID